MDRKTSKSRRNMIFEVSTSTSAGLLQSHCYSVALLQVVFHQVLGQTVRLLELSGRGRSRCKLDQLLSQHTELILCFVLEAQPEAGGSDTAQRGYRYTVPGYGILHILETCVERSRNMHHERRCTFRGAGDPLENYEGLWHLHYRPQVRWIVRGVQPTSIAKRNFRLLPLLATIFQPSPSMTPYAW